MERKRNKKYLASKMFYVMVKFLFTPESPEFPQIEFNKIQIKKKNAKHELFQRNIGHTQKLG